jgi:hypothetical protein
VAAELHPLAVAGWPVHQQQLDALGRKLARQHLGVVPGSALEAERMGAQRRLDHRREVAEAVSLQRLAHPPHPPRGVFDGDDSPPEPARQAGEHDGAHSRPQLHDRAPRGEDYFVGDGGEARR